MQSSILEPLSCFESSTSGLYGLSNTNQNNQQVVTQGMHTRQLTAQESVERTQINSSKENTPYKQKIDTSKLLGDAGTTQLIKSRIAMHQMDASLSSIGSNVDP